jgi:hypothetical protein
MIGRLLCMLNVHKYIYYIWPHGMFRCCERCNRKQRDLGFGWETFK